MRRCLYVLALTFFAAGTCHAASPTTEPADPKLSAAISGLADPDPAKRDQAAMELWRAGRRAEDLLNAAVGNDDPEVANRARTILEKVHFGLSPQSAPDLFRLIAQFRNGSEPLKRAALDGLAARGPGGIRVITGLVSTNSDPNLRAMMIKALEPVYRAAAANLMAEGNLQAADELLAAADQDQGGPDPARHWASLLLTRGQLDARIAALKQQLEQKPQPETATLLACFARANADSATARDAAERSGNAAVMDGVLTDQQAWPELAARMLARVDHVEDIRQLGYLAAYQRLSGDQKGLALTTEAIGSYADAHTDERDIASAARALFLNHQAAAAVALLMKHQDYLGVSQYLPSRMMFNELTRLPQLAADAPPQVFLRLRAHAATGWRFVGDVDKATQTLQEAADQAQNLNDPGLWEQLSLAARECGQRDKALSYLARAIATVRAGADISELLQVNGISNPDLGSRWWNYLRQARGARDLPAAAERVIHLCAVRTPPSDVVALAREIRSYAVGIPAPGRYSLMTLAADTLAQAGQLPEAEGIYRQIASDWQVAAVFYGLGEVQGREKKWAEAATSFDTAWDMDHSQAAPLFLEGYMLKQSGQEQEGRRLMDLAHALPLADEEQRYRLANVCLDYQCPADAERERDLLLRLGDFVSWYRSDALRRAGDAANDRQEYAVAAPLWERAFMDNLSEKWSFGRPADNARMPALVARTRALAALKAKDYSRSLEEAIVCFNDFPWDADVMIELTNAFAEAGRSGEADAIFAKGFDLYSKFCLDHPRSGPAQNQLAWLEACTGRHADEAIDHARQAVAFEPQNTASLDTLAEACFRRGKIADAIAAMQKCIDLEPDEPHHRKQMERFVAARRP